MIVNVAQKNKIDVIMGIKIGIGVILLSNVLTQDDMKYLQVINLSAGATTDITTALTNEPYSVMLLDSSGVDITGDVQITIALSGGVYHIYIYSVDAIVGVKLKILY
jgi:hypothetical protein